MPRIQQIIETLEAERAEIQARLEWLDLRIAEFRAESANRASAPPSHGPEAPVRSNRRATAKRASSRRAAARKVKRDVVDDLIHFLQKHPGSTAGDVAKGLNIDRNAAAARLAVLTKSGEIRKAKRGYAAKDD